MRNHSSMPPTLARTVLSCALALLSAFACAAPGSGPNVVEMSLLDQNWQALKQRHLGLLPVPKRLSFASAPIVLSGPGARPIAIVLANHTPRGDIAVEEIVSRVRELAPEVKLPVLPAVKPGAFNLVIENRWPNAFTRQPDAPAGARLNEQAYRITPTRDGLLLSGQGELGMMYAAVTLRGLIARDGGRVVLHAATVFDWPDFAERYVFSDSVYMRKYADDPPKHLAAMKQVVDFYFRLKTTGLPLHTIYTFRMFSPWVDFPAFDPNRLEATKLVNDYRRARGMVSFYTPTASLGVDERDKGNPELLEMTHDDCHGEYFSWARLDLHRKQAEQMAEFCRRTHTERMYIHALDGGGTLNPENWNNRDQRTREKFGDDRAAADAAMFGEYERAFRQAGVRPLFVVYPYSGETITVEPVLRSLGMADSPAQRAEAATLIKRLTDWMASLNGRLPLDVPFCVREGPHQEMLAFYRGFPGRPMFIYYEVANPGRDALPLLCPEVTTFVTAYDPGRKERDILWCNFYPSEFREPTNAAGMEYAWNTSFPGAHELARGDGLFGWDRPSLNIAAERAAVALYGPELGPALREVYNSDLSLLAAVNPRKATAQMDFRDYARLSVATQEAADRAFASMNDAWAHLKHAGGDGVRVMGEFGYPHFIQLYRMVAAARVCAAVNVHLEQAEVAIRQGNMDRGDQEIAAARSSLAERRDDYERTLAALAGQPSLVDGMDRGVYGHWVQHCDDWWLSQPDWAALAARIDAFAGQREKLFQESNVPAWFQGAMTGGALTAVRSPGPIKLDGVLDDAVWKSAPPVEHFVAWKLMKHCPVGAAARFAYDEEGLYLGFEARQPAMQALREPPRALKDYALTEQVELYLEPPGAERPALQIAVDTAGNVFTAQHTAATEEFGVDLGVRRGSARSATGWSTEVALPWSALGAGAGAGWRAMVAYTCLTVPEPLQVEYFSSVFFDGKQFSSTDRYPALTFAAAAPPPSPTRPEVTLGRATMQTREHATGQGSAISFVPRVESRRPLYDVAVVARLRDAQKRTVWEQSLHQAPFLPLLWEPSAPVQVQLANVYPALQLSVDVAAATLEGGPQTVTTALVLGDPARLLTAADLYAPGPTPGSRGLAAPCWFDTATPRGAVMSLARGTVEFWLKPSWPARAPDEPPHVLFHCGMLRPESPLSDNRDSLVLFHEPKYGNLYMGLSDDQYDRRNAYASIDGWKPGEWHHLACVWDVVTAGKVRMEIYADGVLISGQNGVLDRLFKPATDPLRAILPTAFAAQVGAMNSGEQPAQAVICDVRLSPEPRPGGNFTPPPASAELRADGLLFTFDGSLGGSYRLPNGAGEMSATAGSLMRR